MPTEKIKTSARLNDRDDLIYQPKIELDNSEPIILASFLLPYEVIRNQKDGSLII
jgi:hypothetical protein